MSEAPPQTAAACSMTGQAVAMNSTSPVRCSNAQAPGIIAVWSTAGVSTRGRR